MSTTAPSTCELPSVIRALCPTGYADLADNLFADLARRQAQPAIRTQAMRQVKIDAAQAKDEALQAAIALVLQLKRKTIMDKDQKDRASFIQTQLETTPVGYGLPADYAETARQKDIRLIRAALREWEKINGCSCKSRQPD